MGILEDMLNALERIPAWKRVQNLPDNVARLERRIVRLEAQLGLVAGNQCPQCKALTLLVTASGPDSVFGDLGVLRDHMRCSNCGHTEPRWQDPRK